MQEDRRLAKRMQQGDRRAFEEFIDSFGPRVHALVSRNVNNASDAEDVTQDVFVAIYKSIASYKGDSSLSTWVFRVALNHCLMHRRKTAPVSVPYEEAMGGEIDWQADPARSAQKQELSDQVLTALDTLPEAHRDVVILHELNGLTYQECAQVLDVPVGTVKSRLSNAFRRLRDNLGGYVMGDGCTDNPETMRGLAR